MKNLIPVLLLSLSLTSCFGRGTSSMYGFFIILLILALLLAVFSRLNRKQDPSSRRSNLQILLIVIGLIILWPVIGFILIPILAISMGIFFFFPPLLLLVLVIVLLMNRRGKRRD